jgi:hypothetical protein
MSITFFTDFQRPPTTFMAEAKLKVPELRIINPGISMPGLVWLATQ